MGIETCTNYYLVFCLDSFLLAWAFISLQVKEFRTFGLYINDSVYSSTFFFLTGLHFCHLVVGLFLLGVFMYSSAYNKPFIRPNKRTEHDPPLKLYPTFLCIFNPISCPM